MNRIKLRISTTNRSYHPITTYYDISPHMRYFKDRSFPRDFVNTETDITFNFIRRIEKWKC